MEFKPLAIQDVVLIRPRVFADARGWFLESWHESKFAAAGLEARFVQENHSRSVRHTLRGLHYQIHQAQGKLVRVVTGEIFDVAVDIRRHSPTFGKWVGCTLSAENPQMLWVPPGFAHGFLAMSESVDFLYKCTDFYAPEHERVIRWDDSELAIDWPLPPGIRPLLAPKDAAAPLFRDSEHYP